MVRYLVVDFFFIGKNSTIKNLLLNHCSGPYYGQGIYIYQPSTESTLINCTSFSYCTRNPSPMGTDLQIDTTKIYCNNINSSNIFTSSYHVSTTFSYVDIFGSLKFYNGINLNGDIILSFYINTPGQSSSYLNFFNNSANIGLLDSLSTIHSLSNIRIKQNKGFIISTRFSLLILDNCYSEQPYNGPLVSYTNCIFNTLNIELFKYNNCLIINTNFKRKIQNFIILFYLIIF